MIPLLCRMWTELPQAVCVQDPQQLQRREEEATVKRLPARCHLVCRSSTFHWLQPGSAGGGGSAALAWNHSLVVFILVGFLVVVFFFEWVKMYAQTSLAVVQPQYTHTYTHTCTFCLMARGKPLDFSIRFKPTSRESHSQILTGWASTQIRGGPEHSQTHIRIWPEWTRAACCAIS